MIDVTRIKFDDYLQMSEDVQAWVKNEILENYALYYITYEATNGRDQASGSGSFMFKKYPGQKKLSLYNINSYIERVANEISQEYFYCKPSHVMIMNVIELEITIHDFFTLAKS